MVLRWVETGTMPTIWFKNWIHVVCKRLFKMYLCVGKPKPHPFRRQPDFTHFNKVRQKHVTKIFAGIPTILAALWCSEDLMPRRRCLLTGFLFTSWAPGISFLYRACWCIFCICALFLFFVFGKCLACFLVSLTYLNSVEWHYDFHHLYHLHPQTVHWPLLVAGWSLDPCQLAVRSKFIDTSPSGS